MNYSRGNVWGGGSYSFLYQSSSAPKRRLIMWKTLTMREIWNDVFRFPEDATVFLKLFAFPLLFAFFLFAWWGSVSEKV